MFPFSQLPYPWSPLPDVGLPVLTPPPSPPSPHKMFSPALWALQYPLHPFSSSHLPSNALLLMPIVIPPRFVLPLFDEDVFFSLIVPSIAPSSPTLRIVCSITPSAFPFSLTHFVFPLQFAILFPRDPFVLSCTIECRYVSLIFIFVHFSVLDWYACRHDTLSLLGLHIFGLWVFFIHGNALGLHAFFYPEEVSKSFPHLRIHDHF